jgi:hypothetical protein
VDVNDNNSGSSSTIKMSGLRSIVQTPPLEKQKATKTFGASQRVQFRGSKLLVPSVSKEKTHSEQASEFDHHLVFSWHGIKVQLIEPFY